MRFHPLCKAFPLMEGAAFAELVADIRQHGLREAIWVYEGTVLDGRNRLRACEAAGVDPRFREYSGTEESLLGFVVSVNLRRRQLDESQRSIIGKRLTTLKQGRPGKDAPVHLSDETAAEMVGVSVRSIRSAGAVIKADRDLERAVLDGSVKVKDAASISKKPAPLRRAALAAVEAGEAKSLRQAAKRIEQCERQRAAATADSNDRDSTVITDLTTVAGQFRCVYADPPWEYEDSTVQGAAAHEYSTMALEEICALPVGDLAHEDGAHLWCWTTGPMNRDKAIHEVLATWGYRWVGEIYWNKVRMGNGHWLMSQVEVLVLAVRGNLELLRDGVPNYFEQKRTEHSKKPNGMYDLIESMTPGPRIELFSRSARPGWSRWGDEAPR